MIKYINNKIKKNYLFSILIFMPVSLVFAEESGIPAIFDSSPLKGSVDVSQFAYGNPVTEGVHRIEIYLNDEWKGKADVEFKKIKKIQHLLVILSN